MARTILNETNYLGAGCRKELIGELKKRQMKKALIVTDADLIKFGVFKLVTGLLDEAANAAIRAVQALSKAVKIPQKLSEIGIKAESLPQLAEDAFIDPCTGGNPRTTSVADILKIYETAL